jgi:hypothetical protein
MGITERSANVMDVTSGRPDFPVQYPVLLDLKDQTMVSHCANPECRAPFLYFREGRLIAIKERSGSLTTTRVELFWICDLCLKDLGLKAILERGTNLPPHQEVLSLSEYQQYRNT